ncbi:MAG: alpha/beta hydrolase [Coleofasciculaceae cyanobacterium SM2_1_6]|nr:alpha/beta hydrolase [Coleofasciculaceae cyanobacterium SM2_1_6]
MIDFKLPTDVNQLTETTSQALAQQIKWLEITSNNLDNSSETITTSYVYQRPDRFLTNPELDHQLINNLESNYPIYPIVLLHGFDSSVLEFRRLLPLLAKQIPTYAIDLLGFGFTERKLPINPDRIKSHLYSFWQTLINQPIILVGASMGGAAAIDFALTYPGVVHKLVLIGSAGVTKGSSLGKFLIPPLGYMATSFLANPQVRQKISINAYFDPQLASKDAQICAALHLQCPHWQQGLISFTKSGGYGDFSEKLENLELSTLILWGDHDRILGTKDAVKFYRHLPQSQLVWVEKCGHVPHLEQPEMTAKEILLFLEEK